MEGVIGLIVIYISLADRFTQSPKIEYSLLDPLVPMIPQKAVPVEIPIPHLHLILLSYSSSRNAVKIALTASF
jgi:hypothetical protein